MKQYEIEKLERDFPRVRFFPDGNGYDECPECHGAGHVIRRNFRTLSPSDDYQDTCPTCEGDGEIIIEDR